MDRVFYGKTHLVMWGKSYIFVKKIYGFPTIFRLIISSFNFQVSKGCKKCSPVRFVFDIVVFLSKLTLTDVFLDFFQAFLIDFSAKLNHYMHQIFLKPKRISGKKIFSKIFLILVVSFSIKSIILFYIRQFSFAFFVSSLKTLYKGAAFFNIYFSESFFTLTHNT